MLPPIETKSLFLRQFRPEDVPKVLAMSREPGMREWLPDQVYSDEAQAAQVLSYLIEQYQNPEAPAKAPLVLGVCLRDDTELIGHVGLSPCSGGVEIGYAIEVAHQGKGLATEAIAAMADWGIGTLGLPCILAIVATDNVASCSVLENVGFELVDESLRALHGVTRRVRTYQKPHQAHLDAGVALKLVGRRHRT